MFTREKKLIALLLTAALAFTMNTSMFAAVGAEAPVESSVYAETTTPTTPTAPPAGYTTTDVQEMSSNKVARTVSVNLEGCTVSFASAVPFGGKNNKDVLKALLDSVVIVKDGKTYVATKGKLVQFKSNSADNKKSAFPTVSNAGLQITAVAEKGQTKKDKNLSKAFKDATKVDKKGGKAALGVIVYPFRLTNDTVGAVDKLKASGKAGAYKLVFKYGKKPIKAKQKNGKDSYKDTYEFKLVGDVKTGYLTVSSADIWTGLEGLSCNKITKNKMK